MVCEPFKDGAMYKQMFSFFFFFSEHKGLKHNHACQNPFITSKELCFIELQKLLTGGNEILLYWDKAISWRRGQPRVCVAKSSRGSFAHQFVWPHWI